MTVKRQVLMLMTLLTHVVTGAPASAQSVTVVDEHPRLVFRPAGTAGARTFQDVRDMYNANGGVNAYRDEVSGWLASTADWGTYQPAHDASRYVTTGDLAYAEKALDRMVSSSLSYYGTEGDKERGVSWALAYDWIYSAWDGAAAPPANLSGKLATVEGKLASWVGSAINDLNSGSPSLWHGRASMGALAWTVTMALPASDPAYDYYRERAWFHWQRALKAVHTAGAWPEGPTYWSHRRAITFPLAVSTYQSAVASSLPLEVADPVGDLRTLGLWTAYTERGDGTFNRYGDVAWFVDINGDDYGRIGRSLDMYASITGDPALAAFAEHGRGYKRPLYDGQHGWAYPITFNPYLPKPAGFDPANPAASLERELPKAMLFGREGTGFVAMRQGWSPGDTQITFKAGDYLAHHQHYDQGTFTIFKNTPLAINTGGYGPFGGTAYTGTHRLNYYVRTVASNSILIQRPDEIWDPEWSAPPPGGYTNDGGQRVVHATGGKVRSVEWWSARKTTGENYETGDITAFANVDGDYTYTAGDITRAYNSTLYDSEDQGGKVSLVTRQVLWLQDVDALVVFDRVNSTNAGYKKKWLLHTPNKMIGGTEVVAVGSPDNGIIEVDGGTIAGNTLSMTNGDGKLFLQVVLPASYTINKVGGVDFRYYVEDDGNDADGYDGSNHQGEYVEQSYNDYGDWRIEVSPAQPSTFDTFLNVLSPRDATVAGVDPAELLLADSTLTVVQLGERIVGVGTGGTIDVAESYDLSEGGTFRHIIVDLLPGQWFRVDIEGEDGLGDVLILTANDAGVLAFVDTAAGPHGVSLTPIPEPGVAILLGVGAAAGLWRRRRTVPR
ncbi:hypothetical protein LCGC14_1563490 [marine sediment metagenome]|uniref:PEP-CTERM protein-sorting domain-containing protein n=1 Tax=marine sediment metagenome TaxID=412755 RepID=A0A0F9J7Z0_9ZZZZ